MPSGRLDYLIKDALILTQSAAFPDPIPAGAIGIRGRPDRLSRRQLPGGAGRPGR